jgi:pyridoxal phosphate enzyme (YggS family)
VNVEPRGIYGDIHISENLARLNERLEGVCNRCGRQITDIRVIAVTKNQSVSSVRAAYDNGICDFAENRVQEAERKYSALIEIRPHIRLHMIGHLQSNKAAESVKIFDIIHSVDSVKLAGILNEKAVGRFKILLQVNVADEQTKSGFLVDEVEYALAQVRTMPSLMVEGLMTIAPIAENPPAVRPVFAKLRELKEKLGLRELSMGMTDDYEVAIEEGSTMIRIGRAIFGERRQQ